MTNDYSMVLGKKIVSIEEDGTYKHDSFLILLMDDGSRVTLSSILADEYEAYPEFPKFELIKES